MFWVNISDGRDNSVIKSQQPSPLNICGLVHGIEPGNPRVTLVPFCQYLPQVDDPVLKMLVIPEGGITSRVIRMPELESVRSPITNSGEAHTSPGSDHPGMRASPK